MITNILVNIKNNWALQYGGKVLKKAIKQGQRAYDESLAYYFVLPTS